MQNDTRSSLLTTLGAFIAGVTAGATVVFLSDKKNRKMVTDTIDNVKERAVDLEKTAMKKSGKAKDIVTRKIDELVDELKEISR